MRVVHVLLAGASRYDRSCAGIDLAIGPEIDHELVETRPDGWLRNDTGSTLDEVSGLLKSGRADLLHLHGSTPPPARLLAGLPIPWISDRGLTLPRPFLRRIPPAALVLADVPVPEVATDEWFIKRPVRDLGNGRKRVGSYVRNTSSRNNVAQASGRIQRFRDDVEWTLFDQPPTPAELSALDLWVDPASGEDDIDGMVVEAIACLTPVVAAKTEINSRRLDGGSAGLLPPPGDHNEMTHAVLAMLFKNEVAVPLRLHAEKIRDRFRPDNRRVAVKCAYLEVTS